MALSFPNYVMFLNYITSLSLRFLMSLMRIIILLVCCEELHLSFPEQSWAHTKSSISSSSSWLSSKQEEFKV